MNHSISYNNWCHIRTNHTSIIFCAVLNTFECNLMLVIFHP